MKKSFKRVLASLLAVLMVVFAMPFTALANGADETANWDLVFNAFTTNNKYYSTGYDAAGFTSFNLRGVKDTPLTWNQTAKTLTLEASKVSTSGYSTSASASAAKRYDVSKGDYKLKAGDYFTVTLCLENVQTIFSAGLQFEWTGVEPVDVLSYSYEDDEGEIQTAYALSDDIAAAAAIADEGYDVTWDVYAAKGLPINDLSAGSSYTVLANVDNINGHTYFGENYANFGIAADGADAVDISHFNTQGSGINRAKNPETGANAYAWDYRAPLGTYLFKVTDPDNISFGPNQPAAPGGTFYTTDFAHTSADDAYDYGFLYDVSGKEVEGHSCGMNIMGTNVNKSTPEPTYPTVTITTPAGYDDITYTADASTTTYTVPNLADYTKAADATNHYTAQWKDNNVPSGTFGDADETFEIEFAEAAHTYGDAVINPAPTCTTPGTATYTCSVCNYSYTQEVTDANAHSWGAWTIDDSSWAVTTDQTVEANNSATVNVKRVCANSAAHTETAAATVAVTAFTAAQEGVAGSVTFTATYDGATVGTKTVELEALAHTHNYNELQEIPGTRVASTCKTAGSYQTAMYCACGQYDTATVQTVPLELDPANHENLQEVAAKAATCTEAGNVAYSYCDACGKYYVNGAEVAAADVAIPATDHDFTGAIDLAWTENAVEGQGKWTATAVQHCKNDASHTTERAVTINYTHKDATQKEAGFDKWEAVVNGNVVDTKTETIAAAGVNITVAATDLGTVDGDIITNGSEVTKAFKFGTKYEIRAVRPTGTTFVGWEINGKLVATTETYSSVAYTDTVIKPVFQETADDNINVFFYDKYGNTIKAFTDVSVADYQAAVAQAVPAAPVYPGYKFTGYDKADDVIKANDKSATFWAQYEKDTDAATYTVNAPGATIKADAGNVDGETATNVPYDTKVTVSAEGATAWAVDGNVVAYGSEYTFFVGSDITVTPVADAEVKTVVSIIDVSRDGAYRTFLATRAAGNATIIERGWIYNKDVDVTDATVDAPGTARVKRGAVTGSDQFSLTVKASTGTMYAKAFVVDSNGNVTYSNVAQSN